MSQEKTEVGFIHSARAPRNGANQSGKYDSNGTVVPGSDRNAPGVKSVSKKENQVPVVGFLYSISRQGIGEYWPLHIGRNTIGRSEDCDVCLQERTVSDLHAALNIKQMKTTHKLLASLKDEGSKNGMFINDEELDYDSHSCKNHDIITIGLHYKLLLILIDAEELGLTVSEEFLEDESAEDSYPYHERRDPERTHVNPYDRNYRPGGNNDTIPGTGDFTTPGKTEIM